MKYTFEEIMSEHEYAQSNEMEVIYYTEGLIVKATIFLQEQKKDGMQLMSGLLI